MPRVTIIDDNDDAYEMESEDIFVKTGVYHTIVRVPNKDVFPDDLVRVKPSTVRGWDIVVTHDGDTVSGTITGAEALEIKFEEDNR